jgi:hypothetical protein
MTSAKSRRTRGRPQASKTFQLVPIPHDQPNALKLGRAFLALAILRSEPHDQTDATTEVGRESA